jgi:hypothetical protein
MVRVFVSNNINNEQPSVSYVLYEIQIMEEVKNGSLDIPDLGVNILCRLVTPSVRDNSSLGKPYELQSRPVYQQWKHMWYWLYHTSLDLKECCIGKLQGDPKYLILLWLSIILLIMMLYIWFIYHFKLLCLPFFKIRKSRNTWTLPWRYDVTKVIAYSTWLCWIR